VRQASGISSSIGLRTGTDRFSTRKGFLHSVSPGTLCLTSTSTLSTSPSSLLHLTLSWIWPAAARQLYVVLSEMWKQSFLTSMRLRLQVTFSL
jgi:hypothetical protein